MLNEKFDLSGKIALVTGSTRGIGKAIAIRFLEAGANIVIAGKTEEKLLRTAEEINAAVQNFITSVNKLAKIGGDEGCGASVVGVGSALAMLTAIGAAMIVKKKEN